MTTRITSNTEHGAGTGVDIPADEAMALEPARTIGGLFAARKLIQPVIAALVAVIAMGFGVIASSELVDNLTTIVTFGAVVYGMWSAQRGASQQAKQQAEATRAAVYSPVSAAAIARGEPVLPVKALDPGDPDTW